LQGVNTAKFVDEKDAHEEGKTVHKFEGFEQVKPGKLSALDFDTNVADLVSFMSWMSEPSQNQRRGLGVWVLLFLGLLMAIVWRLNASYWKEVK
jgi:ubiquinol-cytochrome c reductase cytochrome c1 subunit